MNILHLKYAVEVAKAKSINKAAEALYMNQPNLSKAIKDLESSLGITIFSRTAKGVSVTPEGEEFLGYARQVSEQFGLLQSRYIEKKKKEKFSVSMQHYTFAVKAFVETVKQFDTLHYEFAMREGKTMEVISDVSGLKSEIGILYQNDFNREIIQKILRDHDLMFAPLISCKASVYLWKNHPLAGQSSICFEELVPYPCLSFEQEGSFYFSEEILSTKEYPRMIKATDRSTMLNLMVGLNGYTLCSGIICEELNGSDFAAVPFASDELNPNSAMEIGYVVKKNSPISKIGEIYLSEVKQYLDQVSHRVS